MPYNVYFMFSLTLKISVMFVTFLLFKNNLHIVLARGKGPKNGVYRDIFKTSRHSAAFYAPYSVWISF